MLYVFFLTHDVLNEVSVHASVSYSQLDHFPIVVYAERATTAELVIQVESPLAGIAEVTGVFVQVEAQ